jgi:hypothetical protein
MITGSVKIGPVFYDIVLEDKLEDDDYGYCEPHVQRIVISKDQSYQHVGDTLLHEIMHAIWHESGLFSVKRPDEEQIVRTTSTWLIMVINDNPHIIKFIKNAKDHWMHTAEPRPAGKTARK